MKGEQEQAKVCVGGGAINTPASLTIAGGSLEALPSTRSHFFLHTSKSHSKALHPGLYLLSQLLPWSPPSS